jgi:hypothetical protein
MTAQSSGQLSPGQLVALRNLARKQAGEAVDWINIADARALTELGFADRNSEGWRITVAGALALATVIDDGAAPESPPTNISPLRKDDHEGNQG